MKKLYRVVASYTQWIEIEVEAEHREEAEELAMDVDLGEWDERDINDFYIHAAMEKDDTK
jgi:hypothetical protein